MKQHENTAPLSTEELLESLYPILRNLHARRSISAGKFSILRHLTEHERATTAELATAIHVSPQGISLAVREMEAMGYVNRIQDSVDRRKMWLQLTGAGRQKLVDSSGAGYGWLDQVISERLNPQERAVLAAAVPVLQIIGKAAEND